MKTITFLFCLLLSAVSLYSEEGIEYRGIDVKVRDGNGYRHITVKRERAQECQKLAPGTMLVWGGSYAGSMVPDACKKTFVCTLGKNIHPIKMAKEIETYGVLEVLKFMEEMQKDDNKVLVDARREPWYNHRTIPGAVNMPYYYFHNRAYYKDEFAYAMRYLGGIKKKEGGYRFEHPKTILVFCNGPWCSLSSKFVKALEEEGYPMKHIKWFRGGMQAWLIANMTTTRPVQ
ncbi:MAG: rhodanese-like domain-containing protein [Sulfurospirillum sp.]|nr:MAG: rhodanese-like domain-containing protein [Sulfurospirillum sp.]